MRQVQTEQQNELGNNASSGLVKEEQNPDYESDDVLREWPGPQIKIRDHAAKLEEQHGLLTWTVIHNDSSTENLRKLIELKNVVAKQLPNMPTDYITRLVLDNKHKSLIGVKDNKVIGGITFKCFERENMTKFIELVFCAIVSTQQVRGYGSRLMNHLKAWCQKNGFFHILTYADDFAIGYFQRQGFTLEIDFDRRDWDIGFLKHYDSATLMHCKVDTTLDYLEITEILRQQRLTFIKKMRELTKQHVIYPGIHAFKHGAVRADINKIRGLKECGWDFEKYNELVSDEKQKQIYEQNKKLLDEIKSDKDLSWPFEAPVQELYPSEAEKYLREVKDPIDLRTMEEKLESGFYITHQMLLADLQRMVDNCKAYNGKGTLYYNVAEKINTTYLNQKIEVQVVTTLNPGDVASNTS